MLRVQIVNNFPFQKYYLILVKRINGENDYFNHKPNSLFFSIFVKKSGMTQALITTETAVEMKKILDLFRKSKLKFNVVSIQSNQIETSEDNDPIEDNDWILPGRPANSSERKRHAEKITNQRGGIPTEKLKKEIASWREGK